MRDAAMIYFILGEVVTLMVLRIPESQVKIRDSNLSLAALAVGFALILPLWIIYVVRGFRQ